LNRSGRQATAVVEDIAAARPVLSAAGVVAQEIDLNLDEIFEAYVIGRRKEHNHAQADVERVAEQSWKLAFACIVLGATALIGMRPGSFPTRR